MGYSAHVGSFNIDTSKTVSQTQSITGVGFEPKVVILFYGGSTASSDTVAGGTFNLGVAAATSSTSRFCVMGYSEDAQADSNTGRSSRNTELIRCYLNGSLDGIMDFDSMDSDGFTMIVDDQFTQDYRISYLALGGTDLTNVYIGDDTMATSTGEYDITGVGFQPDAVILVSHRRNTIGGGPDFYFQLGMATGASNQGIVHGRTLDAQANSDTAGYGYNGECLSEGQLFRDTFVEFIADGFTLDHLEGGTTEVFHYICLKGGNYTVGDLTTRTDSNDITESGFGFEPVAVLFASANRAHSTQDTITDHCRVSVGAGTSTTNRACAAISDEDALADTETAYANYDSAVYAHVVDDAIEALMDIKSIDSGGFTCVMDDTETTGCWVTYLAIGATAVAAAEVAITASDFDLWKQGVKVVG